MYEKQKKKSIKQIIKIINNNLKKNFGIKLQMYHVYKIFHTAEIQQKKTAKLNHTS